MFTNYKEFHGISLKQNILFDSGVPIGDLVFGKIRKVWEGVNLKSKCTTLNSTLKIWVAYSDFQAVSWKANENFEILITNYSQIMSE